jgi:hypothetical protein
MNGRTSGEPFPPGDCHLPPIRLSTIALALLVITLWLTTRPYPGIIHDSRFYALQALNDALGGKFNGDLYFQYGSQGAFTLFTQIYKPFMKVLGFSASNLVLTLVGYALWLAGLFYFARAALSGWKVAVIGMAAVILLPGSPVFQYGGSFLTPRLFAEALTFWALGSMLEDRPIRAAVLLGVSLTIHPLMTLPGIGVLFVYEASRRPKLWWAALAIAGAVPLLALNGVQPFSRLLARFDPVWFSIVRVRDYFCLPTLWHTKDWILTAITFLLASVAFLMADRGKRRFLGAVLAVGLGGVALGLFGGDLLRNVLVVDLQAWRSTWLLAVVAHLFIGPTLFRIPNRGVPPFIGAPFLFALAIGLLALSQFVRPLAFGADAMVVVAVAICTWEKFANQAMPRTLRIPAMVLMGMAAYVVVAGLQTAMANAAVDPRNSWNNLIRIPLSIVALAAIANFVLDNSGARVRTTRARAAFCATIVVTMTAIFIWDQRTPWVKFIDTTGTVPTELSALLPGTAPIYWDGDVTVPWFLFKRPSYFSCEQGTGALFSRSTAIAYQHRFASFQKLGTLDFGLDKNCPSGPGNTGAPLVLSDLMSLCEEQRGLAALVLTRPVAGAPVHTWHSPVDFEGLKVSAGMLQRYTTNTFFIYSCSNLRRFDAT